MITEKDIQKQCVKYLKIQYPKVLLHHSPQEWYGMGVAKGAIFANHLKAMGTRRGWPDLEIMEPRGIYHGLFIELKTEKGKPSDDQQQTIFDLRRKGYRTEICHSFDEFKLIVDGYLS